MNLQNEDIEGNIIDSEVETDSFLFSDKGTICGILQWKDDNGIIHPIQNAMVGIYRKVLGVDIRIATTYTNLTGYFSISILPYEDVYIGVFAGDDNIKVKSGILEWRYRYIYYDEDAKDEYLYDILPNSTITVNLEPIDMSTDEGQAIQIAQAALVARDYVEEMMNEIPNGIKIIYPADEDSCYYDPDTNKIYINKRHKTEGFPYSYACWDVIMHEYGHYIQNTLGSEDSCGGGHDPTISMADHYKSHYDSDEFSNCSFKCAINNALNLPSIIVPEDMCKYAADKVAWSEAWSTVFGLMAQDFYATRLVNIDTASDASYSSYEGTYLDIENLSFLKGESCELAVTAILWDIFDSSNDSDDTISLGHEAF